MDKKIAGLLGAAAALTAVNGAEAASPAATAGLEPAATYRDLLEPIPNALALLKSEDTRGTDTRAGRTQLAQYHHHHHHQRWWRYHHHHRYYHHHHHHRYYHHHHHHDY
jgi:hypothetical protein